MTAKTEMIEYGPGNGRERIEPQAPNHRGVNPNNGDDSERHEHVTEPQAGIKKVMNHARDRNSQGNKPSTGDRAQQESSGGPPWICFVAGHWMHSKRIADVRIDVAPVAHELQPPP